MICRLLNISGHFSRVFFFYNLADFARGKLCKFKINVKAVFTLVKCLPTRLITRRLNSNFIHKIRPNLFRKSTKFLFRNLAEILRETLKINLFPHSFSHYRSLSLSLTHTQTHTLFLTLLFSLSSFFCHTFFNPFFFFRGCFFYISLSGNHKSLKFGPNFVKEEQVQVSRLPAIVDPDPD